jgi:type II secretory pathway predicted ATPase ExeA
MARALERYWELPFMPLKLRAVLAAACISQAAFRRAILQSNGRPLAESTCSLWLGRGMWLKDTPRDYLEQQTRAFLRAQGCVAADDADLFELDEGRAAERPPTVGAVYSENPVNARRSFKDRHSAANDAGIPAIEETHLEPVMLSQKAKKHFGLFVSPFVDDVQGPDDVFLSADQRYVREAMRQACKRGGHFIGVVGESGSGKTTLRREILDWIAREQLPTIVIAPRSLDKSILTARHIAEAILSDLMPEAKAARSLEALARQIETALKRSSHAAQTHVLMMEEAHDLSINTLKYLKRFWEIEDGFKKLLSIVLIGQPELKSKLDERRYFEAREVIRRCEIVELLPLDGVLADYLALKFKRLDRKLEEIMDADAIDAVRLRLTVQGGRSRTETESRVYPLTVNNLVTRAMNEAAELGAQRITADIVRGC